MQSIVHQHNTSHPSPFFPIWWRTPPALFELRVAQFFTPTRQSPAPYPNPDLTSNEDGEVFPNELSIPISLHILPCCSLANGLVMTSASMSFVGQYWSLIILFSMLLRTNWSWTSRCLVLAW